MTRIPNSAKNNHNRLISSDNYILIPPTLEITREQFWWRDLHPPPRVDCHLCREPCGTLVPFYGETWTWVTAGCDNRAVQKTLELLHCPCSGPMPNLKDWCHFSWGKSGCPEARGGRSTWEAIAGGAASTVDGKPKRAGLGEEGTLPWFLKLRNILCLHFRFYSHTKIFPVLNKCC